MPQVSLILPWGSILDAVQQWRYNTILKPRASPVQPPSQQASHAADPVSSRAATASPDPGGSPQATTCTPRHPAPTQLLLQAAQAQPGPLRQQPTLQRCHAAHSADLGPAVQQASASCVAVQLSTRSWASGVIVSQAGHILTNAHLFSPGTASAIIHFHGSFHGSCPGRHAEVLHIFTGSLDVAVLKLRGKVPQAASPGTLSGSPATPGQAVAVLGYPLLRPGLGAGVLASRGHVAQVLSRQGSGAADGQRQAVLVCTAAVHPGVCPT